MPTQTTLVAAFRNPAEAQAAASELEANGFDSNDIFLQSGNTTSAGTDVSRYDATTRHEGGITGWFKRIFGEESSTDQPRYESAMRSGSSVLSVDTTEENTEIAVSILNRHSPVDIHVDADDARSRTGSRGGVSNTATAATDSQSIPVVEEEMQVGKRQVLRGGVRVYSRLVSQPVEENVRVREEHVRVERQPVNRAANAADLEENKQRVIEVDEYAEEPVISKQARVVEEVRVSKEATERTQAVRDNLRHTEVEVENLAGTAAGRTTNAPERTGRGINDEDFRNNYAATYAASGTPYEAYAPAYQYGYEAANDPRYKGRAFDEIETNLRSDYANRHPNSTWEKTKDAVRYGWDRVSGKARTAGSR